MIVVGITIGLLILLAIALIGAVVAHMVLPMAADDAFLDAPGDVVTPPWAATRSSTERLFPSAGNAVAGRAAGGGPVSGAAARSRDAFGVRGCEPGSVARRLEAIERAKRMAGQ